MIPPDVAALIVLILAVWWLGLPLVCLVWAYLKSWRVERYERGGR